MANGIRRLSTHKPKLEKYKLYINTHTIERSLERHKYLSDNFFNAKGAQLFYGIESKKFNDKHIVRPLLMYKNRIFTCLEFMEDGQKCLKILTALSELHFFSSTSLNFGIHTELKDIKISDTIYDELFVEDSDIIIKNIDEMRFINPAKKNYKKGYDRLVDFDAGKYENYFTKNYFSFPFTNFTFWGVRLKMTMRRRNGQ